MKSMVGQDGRKQYRTPRWVQVWFLRRSRDRWKHKYRQAKVELKRLQNRVNDVTRSRERWRAQAESLVPPLKDVAVEESAVPNAAALKKGGSCDGVVPGATSGGQARVPSGDDK
jgi:hypothetical protein